MSSERHISTLKPSKTLSGGYMVAIHVIDQWGVLV